jgi:hypothetical protein
VQGTFKRQTTYPSSVFSKAPQSSLFELHQMGYYGSMFSLTCRITYYWSRNSVSLGTWGTRNRSEFQSWGRAPQKFWNIGGSVHAFFMLKEAGSEAPE